jgi:hypothetical protein
VLNTCTPKDYIATKMTLDNYNRLTNPREHVQNVHNSLELVIQDNHAMCKILLTTFRGSVRAWYNNLEPGSVSSFSDLYAKLVTHFNTSILAKKSSTKLFGINQAKDESTRTYLKRFNEKMLKVEDLIKW